ncbi:MAG: LacI family transcriptional regulator [Chloroflexi bacterium]|nr:LacI family transcriptional regulator [Chloroflexota bacterium]
MPVTLADVAHRAGVSEATASRVLNGRPYVAARTREAVEIAVRELDYAPNRAARDLSLAKTATIAVLVHHAQYPAHGEGPFSGRVIDGASRVLRRTGHDTLYVHVDDDAVDRLVGLAAVRPGRSDGILVLGPAFPVHAVARLVAASRPVVLVDNRLAETDVVLSDNEAPMRELALHLVREHNHRRLVVLAGPRRWPSTAERVAGVRAAARQDGVEVTVLHAPETTIRDGAGLAAGLLADPPDAVMAVNDAMALGALHAVRELGHRRPAVTGFDDIAWAELADPPLTTVSVDAGAIGAAAASLLLERMAGSDDTPAREIRVPARIRLRRSCGCSGPEVTPTTAPVGRRHE